MVIAAIVAGILAAVCLAAWLLRDKAPLMTYTPDEQDAENLGLVLTASPSLRAKFFAEPTRQVGRQLPRGRSWSYPANPYGGTWHLVRRFQWRRFCRRTLASAVFRDIARRIDQQQLSAKISTDAVFEDYFRPVALVSQRSFLWTLILSVATFLLGAGLVVVGALVALDPPKSVNSTALAAIFGGSGVVAALGSVLAMVVRAISNATNEHAKIRLVLTGFATELGQLRAYGEGDGNGAPPLQDLGEVQKLTKAIERAMAAAAPLIPVSSETPSEAPPSPPETTAKN